MCVYVWSSCVFATMPAIFITRQCVECSKSSFQCDDDRNKCDKLSAKLKHEDTMNWKIKTWRLIWMGACVLICWFQWIFNELNAGNLHFCMWNYARWTLSSHTRTTVATAVNVEIHRRKYRKRLTQVIKSINFNAMCIHRDYVCVWHKTAASHNHLFWQAFSYTF